MTGTLAGADAFWKERVKKEVKTQMVHQEEFEVIDIPQQIDFYNKVDASPNKQATMSS